MMVFTFSYANPTLMFLPALLYISYNVYSRIMHRMAEAEEAMEAVEAATAVHRKIDGGKKLRA